MGNASTREDFGDALEKITRDDIPPDDTDFWDSLWRIPSTAFDIFEMVSPDDVRKWLRERPGNLATLFTQGVAQLCQLVETPNASYFAQALTCVRMLTRLLPFMLESEDERFLEQLFWGTTMTVREEEGGGGGEGEGEPPEEGEPLAALLVGAALRLLHLPGFAVPDSAAAAAAAPPAGEQWPYGNPALIWGAGLGKPGAAAAAAPADLASNRREVLRLLLAALSGPLHQAPEAFDPFASRWAEVATGPGPLAGPLFASLVNTVAGFDPVGWGVPYGTALATDAPQLLLEVAAQALAALLDHGAPGPHNHHHGAQDEGEAPPPNVFRRLLGEIRDPKAMTTIYRGLTRLLNNVHEAESTYLPGSAYKVMCHQEILVLVWKLVEENDAFCQHILKHCDITRLVVPVLFLMYEARQQPAKVGLVHICTFLLLKLSGERALGVLLNKPYQERLPMVDLPIFQGTHADFLIVTLQKIIVTGTDKLSSLYHCFLTIVCNISPYCKTLSLVASVKLVNLFETFSSPRFFFSSETNHLFVALLLEIFNNIIQYQYAGNPHLVYAIVRRKQVFSRLTHLELPMAVRNLSIPPGVTGTGGAAEADLDASLATVEEGEEGEEEGGGGAAGGGAGRGAGGGGGGAAAAGAGEGEGAEQGTPAVPGAQQTIVDTAEQPEAGALPLPPPREEEEEEQKAQAGEPASKEAEGEVNSGEEDESKADTTSPGEDEKPKEEQPSDKGAASNGPSKAEAPAPTPQRWLPTEAWLAKVKGDLPTGTVGRLLTYLVPQINEMCEAGEGAMDDTTLLHFLKSTTMVGLLPVPHPIVIRKYQPNQYTGLWFTAYLWGVVFLRNQGLPIFDGDAIKLFTVTVQ